MATFDVTAHIIITCNRHPPSSVPANIMSHISILNPEIIIKEVPSVSYIFRCRTILRIVGKTLASFRLAKAEDWKKLCTDGTSRRQSAIQTLIIGIMEDSNLQKIALITILYHTKRGTLGRTI